MNYETVIGMEVHVELHTKSKMFCRCPADHFQVDANQHICPVCTAQPGALPVINGRAIELTVMTGMALGCEIRPHSVFARKNYVYPDLPKGYQVSQYELPLCEHGRIRIAGDGDTEKHIAIERVHLEEDAGKLQHQGNASLVDYNRAGVPLMEIVTDASIRSADEACAYLLKIRQLVRYLGASTGDMEKGAMRCEANISVRVQGTQEFGTKVEVKNLNSFRAVRNAIEKLWVSTPISRWFTMERRSRIRNSIGASIVMMWQVRFELICSIIAARVVDLPDPVVPVTRISPRCSSEIRSTTFGRWS